MQEGTNQYSTAIAETLNVYIMLFLVTKEHMVGCELLTDN